MSYVTEMLEKAGSVRKVESRLWAEFIESSEEDGEGEYIIERDRLEGQRRVEFWEMIEEMRSLKAEGGRGKCEYGGDVMNSDRHVLVFSRRNEERVRTRRKLMRMREEYEQSGDEHDRMVEEYLFENLEVRRVSVVLGVGGMSRQGGQSREAVKQEIAELFSGKDDEAVEGDEEQFRSLEAKEYLPVSLQALVGKEMVARVARARFFAESTMLVVKTVGRWLGRAEQ